MRRQKRLLRELVVDPSRLSRDLFITPARLGYDVVDEQNQLIRFNRGAVPIINTRLPDAQSDVQRRDLVRLIELIEAQSPLLDADGELTFDAYIDFQD